MHPLVPDFILQKYEKSELSGTMLAAGLFIDISGFSAMTDTLMAHGQHGAEVLAGVIQETFEPLIRDVYSQEGFVASQAGDAFTALFPCGESQELCARRALSAAISIQNHVAQQLVHSTVYGNFTISVKAGLAFGEVNWGIVSALDGSRTSYYFQGSPVDNSAAAEQEAEPGEIILDQDLYVQLNGSITSELKGTHHRVIGYPNWLLEPLPIIAPTNSPELAKRFFPGELLAQELPGEFRQIVHVFINLKTIHTDEQLSIFMQTVFELQTRYGGLLNGLDFGDKGAHLFLFWGAPVAYENDVERALNFVLALQTHTAIPITGGITYQMAHAGFVGSDLRQEYTANGRGVNLAARFMTHAPRGEIWVDENVARWARGRYDLEPLGEHTFKGFFKPQKVFALVERLEIPATQVEGPLVGREDELRQLEAFVQPIFGGKYPGLLVISGEPGAGKSRLVQEFLNRLEQQESSHFHYFLAQTDEILRSSLNPFTYWLRTYFQVSEGQSEARNKRSFNRKLDDLISITSEPRLANELDRTRSFLGALIGLFWPDSLYAQLEAKARFDNTLIGLATLLQAESRRLPLVLLVEDVHWLDEDSKIFLHRLLQGLAAETTTPYPLALIASARLEESGLPLEDLPSTRIPLQPVHPAAMSELAQAFLKGMPGERLLKMLVDHSDGNPFFAEQILHYLKDEGCLTWNENAWEVKAGEENPLPGNVNAMLVARLDRLERSVKETVQTAAVLGREFEVNLLARLLDDRETVRQDISSAEQKKIWMAIGEIRYLFHHALLWEAAYKMQLHARRQRLHRLVVQAIETVYAGRLESQYTELAYHAEQAGLPEQARKYLRLAGETALANYANASALDFFTRALALTAETDGPIRFELLRLRLEVLFNLARHEEIQAGLLELEELAQRLDEPVKLADVLVQQARLKSDMGDFPQSVDLAKSALSLALNHGEKQLALQAYQFIAAGLMRQQKLEASIEQIEQGLELARQIGHRQSEANSRNLMGMIRLEQGQLGPARQAFEQALSIAQEINNLEIQTMLANNLGNLLGYQGEYQDAQEAYERALALDRKIGLRKGEGIVLGNLGWIAGMMGKYESAKAYAEQGLAVARETGSPFYEMLALTNLSNYAGSLGDLQTAQSCAEQALNLARKLADRSSEAWALTYLGHSLYGSEDNVRAMQVYREAADIRIALGQEALATEPYAGLARVALMAGDLAQAQEYVAKLLAHLDSGGSFEGTDHPTRVYLICYQVLEACGSPRANDILNTAHTLLQKRAAGLLDEADRQAFLWEVSDHRAIVEAWEQRQAATA